MLLTMFALALAIVLALARIPVASKGGVDSLVVDNLLLLLALVLPPAVDNEDDNRAVGHLTV